MFGILILVIGYCADLSVVSYVVARCSVKYLDVALCLPQSYCCGATARQASIRV